MKYAAVIIKNTMARTDKLMRHFLFPRQITTDQNSAISVRPLKIHRILTARIRCVRLAINEHERKHQFPAFDIYLITCPRHMGFKTRRACFFVIHLNNSTFPKPRQSSDKKMLTLERCKCLFFIQKISQHTFFDPRVEQTERQSWLMEQPHMTSRNNIFLRPGLFGIKRVRKSGFNRDFIRR